MAPLDPSQPDNLSQASTTSGERRSQVQSPIPPQPGMAISAASPSLEVPVPPPSSPFAGWLSMLAAAFPIRLAGNPSAVHRDLEINSATGLTQAAEQNPALTKSSPTTLDSSTTIENILLTTWKFTSGGVYFLGSVFGVTFVLAWIATIPVVQILSLGFLVEVTHRVIQTGRIRDGIVGREKGWFLFKLLIGISLSLLPLYLVSNMRFDAWLIAPGSNRYQQLQRWETAIFVFTVLHLLGAGLCGTRLRHFLWPILLPWYMMTGTVKWILNRSLFRRVIDASFGRVFPKTTAAFFHSQPLSQWFVPAVLWRHIRQGTLISEASQRFWGFIGSLRLVHYAKQGFGALVGVSLWFAGPTFWVLTSTRSTAPPIQGITYLLFLGHLFLVLLYFPFAHSRYCKTGNVWSYFQWRKAGRTFQYSPMRLTIAMLFSLLLSTPLWFMRIAMVPYDLWWIFSLFYVALLWPTWMLWGWATHHGDYERLTQEHQTLGQQTHEHTNREQSNRARTSADFFVANQTLTGTAIPTATVASDTVEYHASPTGELALAANAETAPARLVRRCSFAWIWVWRILFVALVAIQLLLTVLSIYVCWQGAFNVLLHPMFNVPTPFGPDA